MILSRKFAYALGTVLLVSSTPMTGAAVAAPTAPTASYGCVEGEVCLYQGALISTSGLRYHYQVPTTYYQRLPGSLNTYSVNNTKNASVAWIQYRATDGRIKYQCVAANRIVGNAWGVAIGIRIVNSTC